MIGDISGIPGMGALFLGLSQLVKRYKADFIIVNGENAASGFGLTDEDYHKLKQYGVDVITSGNHIWQRQEIYPYLDSKEDLLRPINYPKGVMGHGVCQVKKDGVVYAVVNAQGRIDMPLTDCPFRTTREAVEKLKKQGCLVLVDFHAENSMEKEALGFYLDGLATAVVGTHTHVQTLDEKILPGGTAYITDLGMSGVQNTVIGSKPGLSIKRQLTQVPIRSEVSEGEGVLKGVVISADADTGKALEIIRF